MKVGIYTITNMVTSGFYIGSSVEVERRWLNHLSDLRRNTHRNKHLQHSFNKYGESALMIECEQSEIRDWEQIVIDAAVLNADCRFKCLGDRKRGRFTKNERDTSGRFVRKNK